MKKRYIAECVFLALLMTMVFWMSGSVEQKQTVVQSAPAEEAIAQDTQPQEQIEATWIRLPDEYELTCQNFFVYDLVEERFIMASGGTGVKLYPASITKLFSAYVAMQHLDGDVVVTVGEEIDLIDSDSTTAGLKEGDRLTVNMLIAGMMLPSGNDAAYALAVAAGRQIAGEPGLEIEQALELFVEEMNAQAELLGMHGSHFKNPDGIHASEHYMSIQDMCQLGKMTLENPLLMEYAQTPGMTVQVGDRELTWRNTNALLHDKQLRFYNEQAGSQEDEEAFRNFYCQYTTGLKTGRTTPAGSCLLSSFDACGRKLMIGVFDCPDGEYRFSDTVFLLNMALGV